MKFKQRDGSDCGPACLGFVADYYRLRLPLDRQIAGTDAAGTTALGLIEAAAKLGFQAKGVRGPFESLAKVPKPVIAHLELQEDRFHFVVLTEVSKRWVKVMDPADGRFHRHSRERFWSRWTGVLVMLGPGDSFETDNRKTSIWWRFWRLIWPHRWALRQAFINSGVLNLALSALVMLFSFGAMFFFRLATGGLVGGDGGGICNFVLGGEPD